MDAEIGSESGPRTVEFSFTWSKESYGRLYRTLALPHTRRSGGIRQYIFPLSLAILNCAFGALQAGLIWLLYNIYGWSLLSSSACTILLYSICFFLGTFDPNIAISKHMRVLSKDGPVRFQLTDTNLIGGFASGFETHYPWGILRLGAENQDGLLITIENHEHRLLLPKSAMGDSVEWVLAKLRDQKL